MGDNRGNLTHVETKNTKDPTRIYNHMNMFSKALAAAGRADLAKLASDNYSFSGREATVLSFIGAHMKLAGAPGMEDAVKMANFWGIRKEAEELAAKVAKAMTPRKLAEADFALCAEVDGQKVLKYAAYDRDSVVEAANAFHENKDRYPYAWRKVAAARLLAKAEQFKAVLPEYVSVGLHKSAGLGFPTAESLEDALIRREHVATSAQKEALAKIATVVGEMVASPELRYDDEMIEGLITNLDEFDAQLPMFKMAEVGLAEEIIEDGSVTTELVKMAGASSTYVMLKNGFEVDATTIPPEALEAIDPELAKMASAELIDVLPTLDYEAASLLTRLL